MRPIHLTDLDAAVRSVLHLKHSERSREIRKLISRAELGDRYRKRTGRTLPKLGNGSLSAASMPQKQRSFLCDAHYQRCLIELLLYLRQNKFNQFE